MPKKGYKLTLEQRARVSAGLKGNKNCLGRKCSAETRAKISKAQKGKRYRLGCKHTQITKDKISNLQKGNKRCVGRKQTPESKARQSITMKKVWALPEHKTKISAANNHGWRGGLSNEPYPAGFNQKLKKLIRERDGYVCRICGKTQEHNSRALAVHHIDWDKDNLDPKNLISLCASCHVKTQTDRFFWAIELRQVS